MINSLWFILYFYFIYQEGRIIAGVGKLIVTYLFMNGVYFTLCWIGIPWIGALAIIIIMEFYVLFFDEEPFHIQAWLVIGSGLPFLLCNLFRGTNGWNDRICLLLSCGLLFSLLWKKRRQNNWFNLVAVVTGNLALILASYLIEIKWKEELPENLQILLKWGIVIWGILFFVIQEKTLWNYQKGYTFQTNRFQEQLLMQQYEEIQVVYLNMRGWRHDYHNHIQVLKAQMDGGEYKEARQFLNDLESELERVDTYVRSGNGLLDAVLNSKLSIAEKQNIRVDCKAELNEDLSIKDIDLCIILGNLMDNCIEACGQIIEEKRFIRIYIVRIQNQLYLSIQNSAKEELDFEEKNYISKKRGNHGLGMKRVKAIVDKYEGYMRLSNESGIFGTEIMIPLDSHSHFTNQSDN